MKLSIIITAYNTEKERLDACLESIYSSTLKDFEVVLIDDGSEICYKEIVEKYNPVYVKTENRGQLAARLYALMLAKGDYVAYVDSDDTVTFNYHEPMVETAIEDGCDIVMNDWAFKTQNGYAYCPKDITISQNVSCEGDDLLKLFTREQGRSHSTYVLWNKVFKKSLLMKAKADIEKTHAIMKKQTYGEDMLICFFAFKNGKKLKNIHTGYYIYCVHEGQTINVDAENSCTRIMDQIDAVNKNFAIMYLNLEDNEYSEQIARDIMEWRHFMARTHYSYAKSKGYTVLYDYIKCMYGLDELKGATVKDSSGYMATGLLGENFDSIDRILRFIYQKGQEVCVKYDKKDKYVKLCLDYMSIKYGIKITYGKDATIVIPKRKISLKTRIFHSKPLYTLGFVLFPKGSEARAKLKKRL
ncbi:MAG: glycosyltransferase family 2 protein [Clostridia bacterium]|nr:glycosyltransferase family 2 protein [Clostridia bacterium]